MNLKILLEGKWTIITPMKGNGSSELEDFLDGLSRNFEANIAGVMAMMEQHCNHGAEQFNTSQCHYIDQKEQVYEYIKGRIRVFWFEDDERVVICTHGILKKSQKTPKTDIQRALSIKAKYMQAKKDGSLSLKEV